MNEAASHPENFQQKQKLTAMMQHSCSEQTMNAPSVQAITTASAPAPVGPYNQAVLAGGWLYCSGQIALDPTNGVMVGQGDVEAETRQVLSNLMAVLTAAGAEPRQVIRTTVYLTDLADFQRVNALYGEIFGDGISPARACVQVAALPKGGRVEIDCVAWLG
ncbi:Enamine/imine deaminase [Prochlorococcus marinus str. MIT 1313]|nr:Enamine/imine deaminase [Prochlorococcus marinus str. MIT 1312]KZR69589.1 Enamine/imine deaminase [Prochlorococcus marinus str. MIT 1313]KZR72463.1 Enamine/imine deaminase [Prochlorococcus marinus str. MIT 1318]